LRNVTFLINIRKYKIPLAFHEARTRPKKYLSRSANTIDAYVGKLQFCHRLHGQKVKLAEEKTYLAFDEKIDYLVEKLFLIADSEDRDEEEIRQRNEKREAESRAQAEAERKETEKRLAKEKHRLANKRRVQDMINDEKTFFQELTANAKAYEECRLMREYIEEIRRRWNTETTLNDDRKAWLLRAEVLIKRHDPFVGKRSKTISDVKFPDSIWDASWDDIWKHICQEMKK